jgi:predicted HNH restriction endonuclease
MVPLCASCHGFVHSRRPALTMERAREIIEMAKAEKAAK